MFHVSERSDRSRSRSSGQTDQIDHNLDNPDHPDHDLDHPDHDLDHPDHLDPNLTLLGDAIQDLHSTDPTHELCPINIACSFLQRSPPAT